jgi:hypothetical protein
MPIGVPEKGERRVRTLGGAKKFGMPIGSTIDPEEHKNLQVTSQVGSPEGSSSGGVVQRSEESPGQASMVRLRSLRRQVIVAQKLGNVEALESLRKDFALELDEYRQSATNARLSTTMSRLLSTVR